MVFRPRARARWSYPPAVFLLVSITWYFIHAPGKERDQFNLVIIVGSLATIVMIWLSWRAWTTLVVIDDMGIRWRGSRSSGQLRWGEISGLGYRRVVAQSESSPTTLDVGLIETQSGELRILPFLQPKLYETLKARFAPLPPEVEAEWFSRPRGADEGIGVLDFVFSPRFCRRGSSLSEMVAISSSWTCFKCGTINPPRLRACGQCSYPR
jgi:hypothetical protein